MTGTMGVVLLIGLSYGSITCIRSMGIISADWFSTPSNRCIYRITPQKY